MIIHRMSTRPLTAALFATLLAGCGTPGSDPGGTTGGNPTESATPPVGTQVHVGGALTMREVTSDGWAIYSDNATLTLHAVPIAGGAPQDIVALGNDFAVSNWGKVVFAWSHKSAAGVGALTVWTAASGAHTLSQASLAPWVAASTDGSHILYLDKVDAAGQTGDLVTAGGDGSSPKVLLTALDGLQNDGCRALMGFAGTYALAGHCDAGAKQVTISSFAMPSWTRADLATNAADNWSTDPAGTLLLTATSAGTIVVPLAGGAATTIDPTGGTGVLVDNGKSAIYGTSANALRRSPVSAPSPTTLVASGVGGLYAVSPDEKSVMFYKDLDPVHLVSDMYLTSAATAGAPMTLSATQTAGVFGDPFTADASHALYSTEVDPMLQTSTLNTLALSTQTSKVVAHDVSVVWAATGAKIVFSDHYAFSGSRGHADVRTFDTSKGGDPTLIVNQADSEIFLSPAHDQIIYTWSLEDSARAGLYVAPIP